MTLKDKFWENQQESQEIIKELNLSKKNRDEFNELHESLEDANVLLEFIENGELEFENELNEKINTLRKEIEDFKIRL